MDNISAAYWWQPFLKSDRLSNFAVSLASCTGLPIFNIWNHRYMVEVLPIRRKTPFNHSINQSINIWRNGLLRACKGSCYPKQHTKFYLIIWGFPSVLFDSLSLTTSTSLSNCDFDSIARNVISKYK